MRLITVLGLGMQAMVLAAPAAASKSMMYKEEEWIIHDLVRSCGHHRHHDDHYGHGHDHNRDYGHGKDHGKNHGHDKGRNGKNGHHGSSRNGYKPDRHKDSSKSSNGRKGNKYDYHEDNKRKGYTNVDQTYGPRKTSDAQPSQNTTSLPTGVVKLEVSKAPDDSLVYTTTATSDNGTATTANATTQLPTATKHGDKNKDECRWSFTVVTQQRGRERCTFEAGRRASVSQVGCGGGGNFVVSSGWSGQFGEGQGFTTLSVIDRGRKLIVWPAYRDSQLEDGKVVRPDQSYVPQHLP